MFKQLFKPKWRHQDPAQRLAALQQLSPNTTKSQQIIAQLCRDTDSQVQKTAIGLCTDSQLLEALAAAAPPVSLWAQERRIALLSDQGPEALGRFIRTASDADTLVQLATNHSEDELRHLAVRRLEALDAQTHLLEVACNSRHSSTRLQAAHLLTAAETWRELQKQSRDKAVQQWVREQLRQHQAQQQEREHQAQERAAVLQELKQHPQRLIDNLYEARLAQWQQQWHDNAEGATQEEQALFAQYVAACEAHLAEHQAEIEAERARQAAKQQQDSTLADYQTTLKRFAQPGWEQEYGQITAALTLLERHWQQLSTHYRDASTQERFAKLQSQWQQLQQKINAYFEFKQQEVATTEAPEALLADWPNELHNPLAVVEEEAAVTQEPSSEEAPSTREEAYEPQQDKLYFQLRSALRQRNLRQANRHWKRLENELEKQPNPQRARRFEGLREQLQELQDWHNFAAEPKKEELCQRMEALIAEPLSPPEKANAIQALHQEWRELMSSDQEADQALWDRFKEASDKAYEPCKEHFKELDAQRAQKLQERQALCEQLEALLIQTKQETAPDWQALFTIRRQAPQSYFAIEPVRYTDARPTDQRFSGLLKAFDAVLEQASKENLPKHEALLDAAAALSEASTTNPEEARALQQQWRDLPWLHPKHYRKLNKAFHQHIDAAFARITEQRQQAREQHEANKEALAAALEDFNNTLSELSPAQIQEQIQILQALPCPPREKALAKKRDAIVQKAEQRIKQWPLKEQWQRLNDQLQTMPVVEAAPENTPTVVIAAEVICQVESPADDKDSRFQWQLEQLPKMMTQGQAIPLQQMQDLLEQHQEQLNEGLTAAHQARILNALAAIKP